MSDENGFLSSRELAEYYIDCMNARDIERLVFLFDEDAIFHIPDLSSGEYQEIVLKGWEEIRAVWQELLDEKYCVDAVLDSVFNRLDGIAVAYRVHGMQIIDVIAFSSDGSFKRCERFFGEAVSGYAFFSYARGEGLSNQIASFMEYEELPAWVDNELKPGERWAEVLKRRIAGSSAFILIMDDRSAESEYVKKELALAEEFGKPIIPVLVGSTPFPELAHMQYVLFSNLALPEFGFPEFLRDLLAPGQIPSKELQRRRVDYFVRRNLMEYIDEQHCVVEIGVGSGYYFGIQEDQPLDELDDLDWVEMAMRINESMPKISVEDIVGDMTQEFVLKFPTPSALVDELFNLLDWEDIKKLGLRESRMDQRGDPSLNETDSSLNSDNESRVIFSSKPNSYFN